MSFGAGWADALAERLRQPKQSPQPQAHRAPTRRGEDVRVTALSVAPVKGTRLQMVDAIQLGQAGARGDRRFFVIDERDRMVNAKTLGELQMVEASFGEASSWLALTFPDGRVVEGRVHDSGEVVEAQFYSDRRPARVLAGPWAEALSNLAGRPLRLVDGGPAVDRGVEGAVSLISRASLEGLASEAEVDQLDARRFRMLFEIEGVGAHTEDRWVGRSVQIGQAVVRFEGHVGRCLITSRDPESGEITLPTLDVLRSYRGEIESTEPLPFGVHGRVVQGGRVVVGDPVTLLSD
jgi:uncharacterized protein YcbX